MWQKLKNKTWQIRRGFDLNCELSNTYTAKLFHLFSEKTPQRLDILRPSGYNTHMKTEIKTTFFGIPNFLDLPMHERLDIYIRESAKVAVLERRISELERERNSKKGWHS